MLNIEHLLTEQRYLALDEISTVFLAIGIAQYTIYIILSIENIKIQQLPK